MKSMVVVLGLVIVCAQAWAERVELNNGDVYEGKVIERTDEIVTLSTSGAPLYLSVDQIKTISEDVPVPADPVTAGEPSAQTVQPTLPTGASQALLGGVEYSSKNLKCSFKIPDGFAIVKEDDKFLMLTNDQTGVGVLVSRMAIEVIPTDKMVDSLAIEMVMRQLGVATPSDLQNVVKLYGQRQVSSQHAFWMYYPVAQYDVLNHRTFIAGKDKAIYEVNVSIPFTDDKNYVENGDKFANAFLLGFKID